MNEGRDAGMTSRRGLMRTGAALTGVVGAGLATRSVRAADSIDDSLLKRVLDRGRVIVGTGATNPPWHFEDEDGKLIGMDIDMAKELAIGLFGIEEDPLAATTSTFVVWSSSWSRNRMRGFRTCSRIRSMSSSSS